MREFSAVTTAQCTPDEVWDLLLDLESLPEWVDSSDRMLDVPDDPVAVGSTYRERGGVWPFLTSISWEVTHLRPSRYLRMVGDDGRYHLVVDCDVETVGGSLGGQDTRLTITVRASPRWWLLPLDLLLGPVRRRFADSLTRTLKQARSRLELPAGAGATDPDPSPVGADEAPASVIDVTDQTVDAT